MTDQDIQIEYTRKKWRTRRRMAISSFVTVVCMVAYYALSPLFMTLEQVQSLSQFNSIIITLIAFLTSVIMLYIGASTYEDNR